MATATYSKLRSNLAKVWDAIEDTQEPIIVSRKGHEDIAILPASELASLRETAHLLRSPRNAARLLQALTRAMNGEGQQIITPAELRARFAGDAGK
ncbi:MAG: type II toxin-antitoxin system Phd/YefM family antitoxin [Gemmatimonadota bacterium]|nr:type II toxin-antitoxin system Phd/YefM family antitoxin [Gemmatimonadota bacterium]